MADIDLISEFTGITITSDQTTGTNNPNATFAVPSVTTAQRANLQNVTPYVVGANTYKVKPGTIIYNITTKTLQIFDNFGWENLISSAASAATGAGLTSGTPLILPTGVGAAVEAGTNNIPGFIYYNTTTNTVKIRTNATWVTVTTA